MTQYHAQQFKNGNLVIVNIFNIAELFIGLLILYCVTYNLWHCAPAFIIDIRSEM